MDRSLKNLGWKKRVRFLAKKIYRSVKHLYTQDNKTYFEGMHIFMDTVQTY